MLLERRVAEGPTAGHSAADELLHTSIVDGNLESGSDSGTIGLFSLQLDVDPVVRWMPGISEQRTGVLVSRHCPSDLDENIFLAVIIEITDCNPVSLLKVASP